MRAKYMVWEVYINFQIQMLEFGCFKLFKYLNYFGLKQYVTKLSGSDTAPEEGLQKSPVKLSAEANSTLWIACE